MLRMLVGGNKTQRPSLKQGLQELCFGIGFFVQCQIIPLHLSYGPPTWYQQQGVLAMAWHQQPGSCHPTREGYVGRFLPTWAIRTIKMKRPQLSGANAIVRISSHQSIGMCLHVGGVVQRVAVEWKGVHYYLQYTFSMMWPTAFVLHLVHFDSSTLLVKPYDNRDQTTGKPAKPENDGVLFWQLPCAKLPSCNQP
jgi:hypothetical protein